MNVIRHDDVTAHQPAVSFESIGPFLFHQLHGRFTGQDRAAPVSAGRYEIDRVRSKHTIESKKACVMRHPSEFIRDQRSRLHQVNL